MPLKILIALAMVNRSHIKKGGGISEQLARFHMVNLSHCMITCTPYVLVA